MTTVASRHDVGGGKRLHLPSAAPSVPAAKSSPPTLPPCPSSVQSSSPLQVCASLPAAASAPVSRPLQQPPGVFLVMHPIRPRRLCSVAGHEYPPHLGTQTNTTNTPQAHAWLPHPCRTPKQPSSRISCRALHVLAPPRPPPRPRFRNGLVSAAATLFLPQPPLRQGHGSRHDHTRAQHPRRSPLICQRGRNAAATYSLAA